MLVNVENPVFIEASLSRSGIDEWFFQLGKCRT